MNPSGDTRTVVTPNHAVICPRSQVGLTMPGWERGLAMVQVSSAMGSRFTQIQAVLDPGGCIDSLRPWVERFVFVLEGEVVIEAGEIRLVMHGGDYFYAPPEQSHRITANATTRLLLFEHNYYALTGVEPPTPQFGRSANAQGKAYRGDPDVLMQMLLPNDATFDMAVNLFSLYPGASMPTVSSDGAERGLYLLDGQGIARLGEHWYPVQKGDTLWAKGHCPFWFAATGKTVTRFVQYEDTNREPVDS